VAAPSEGKTEQERGYLVFSQQGLEADIDAWNAYAERFLGARLGLSEPPARTAEGCVLRIVVSPSAGPAGILAAHGRARDERDLALAEAAESLAQGGGLALLARRCPTVWIVERRADDDPLALRLATVLAGTLLGPILDRRSREIFGVKTARAKMEALLR
jgi:hypothetical protein